MAAAKAAEAAFIAAKKLAAEKAKKAAQAAAKKAADLAKTASAKAADMTKKTGNPAQKSSQAKANPTSSSAAGNGGGGGGKKPVAPESKGDDASGGGRSDGGSSSGGSCPVPDNSFVPGTRVLMADGTSKPIEDVKTGDEVRATEAETGETRAKTVTATITGHGVKHLVKIVIDTDGEQDTDTAAITATDGHPFWAPELDQWLDATDLQPGQWLHTSAGTWIQITAINRWTTPSATVHNLTISDIHTYYVVAGDESVLVHNCGGSNAAHADRCTCANGGPVKLAVSHGDVGSFRDLKARARAGDGLTPDHIPQAASRRLNSYGDYAAVMLTEAEHALTRDFSGRGVKTKAADAGLSFREVVALKLWNYRQIGQQLHGDPTYFNGSIREVLKYYRTNYPGLGV